MIEQKEYFGAIRHLFNAIKLKPFYPYLSYEEFKEEYMLKNASELSNTIVQVRESLRKSDEKINIKCDDEKLELAGKENYGRRKYPEMPLFQEIITEIVKRANSERLNKLIEKKLRMRTFVKVQ